MVRGGRDSPPLPAGPAGRYQLTQEDTSARWYKFEVRVPHAPGMPPVPWLLVILSTLLPPSDAAVAPAVDDLALPACHRRTVACREDPDSSARISTSGSEVTLEYTLASGPRRSQFAAAVTDLQAHAQAFKAIAFSIAASHPGRVSMQLRYPNGGGERWAKSVYADSRPGRQGFQWSGWFLPTFRAAMSQPHRPRARCCSWSISRTHGLAMATRFGSAM